MISARLIEGMIQVEFHFIGNSVIKESSDRSHLTLYE